MRRSRTLGAFLSFLIPGTGQLLEGRIRVGLFFLAPFLLAVLIGIVVANGDRAQLLGFLVQPNVLMGVAILDVLIFIWRAAAILDAWWGGGSKVPHTILSTIAVVALLAVTGATHYVVGAQVMAVHDTFAGGLLVARRRGRRGRMTASATSPIRPMCPARRRPCSPARPLPRRSSPRRRLRRHRDPVR